MGGVPLALALLIASAPSPSPSEAETLSAAFAALREAGFPSLGGTYRAFEAGSTCDGEPKTRHGWVAADAHTALALSGVVYPVTSLSPAAANLEADLKGATLVSVMVLANQATPAKAQAAWKTLRHRGEQRALQALATDWQHQLLERAVCLHRLANDEGALELLETIESLTKRSLAERDEEATELLADHRRRARDSRPALAFTSTPSTEELKNWLEHLDEVGVRPPLQLPGFLDRDEPLIDGLASRGAPIAGVIIDATENDHRLTRVKPKGQPLLRVSEVAVAVLRKMFNPRMSDDELEPTSRTQRARLLRERWAQWQKMGPAERAMTTLDDEGSTAAWPQAARELSAAIDENDPALKTLRARPAPTVTAQLIKRINDDDARCEVAKVLRRWAGDESLDALEQVTGACLPWAAQTLADSGRPAALDRLAAAMKGRAVALPHVMTACAHPEHTALQSS